jgi:acetyl esterase
MDRKALFAVLSAFIIVFLNQGAVKAEKIAKLNVMNQYTVVRDVEWARPKGFSLTMDVYVPQTGKNSYPVIIIYHGGGWLINNKSIMDSMAIYIVQHSDYIVCNVNYRLLGDNSNSIRLDEVIEDAFGSLLWVKENISAYKGDPSKIAVTGDSAGGHLAAMVILGVERLNSEGFTRGFPGFNPTFLPKGMSAEEVVKRKLYTIQAAILSYPAVDIYESCLKKGFETEINSLWARANCSPRGIFGDSVNVRRDSILYKAVSPVYNIPNVSERILPPQLCIVGSKDQTTKPETIQKYVALLKSAGQEVEYWEYTGKPHAFLDTKPNLDLGTVFYRDAPPAIDRIIEFLDTVFN